MKDPDKNYFNNKLKEMYSPYLFFKNFKIFSKTVKRKSFFYLQSYIRSLWKNIDKLKEFLASLNGSFIIVVVAETWCDATANKSLLGIPNYFALPKTSKNKKGGGVGIYIHKNLKFISKTILIYLMNQWKQSLQILKEKNREIL